MGVDKFMLKKILKAKEAVNDLLKAIDEIPNEVQRAYDQVNVLDKKTTDRLHEIEMLKLNEEEIVKAAYDLQYYKRKRRQMYYIQDTLKPFLDYDIQELAEKLDEALELAIEDHEREVNRFESLVYQYREGSREGETIVKEYSTNWGEDPEIEELQTAQECKENKNG